MPENKTFKFLISGNFHLGKDFKGFPDGIRKKLITAQEKVFDEFINLASNGEYTGALIVGDLFDSLDGAKLYAKKVFEDFRKVIITGASVLATTGNNDPQTEGDFWTTTVTPLSFSFYKSKSYTSLTVAGDKVTVGGIAFDPFNAEKRISEILPEPKTPLSILLVHASIVGENHNEEKAYEMTMDEIEGCPFTIIALGHSHKFHQVGQNGIFAGSPQGTSFSDEEFGERFFAEAEIFEDNTVKFSPIKVKSAVELGTATVNLNGKGFDQLINEIEAQNSEDKILQVNLEGKIEKEAFLKLDELPSKFKNSFVNIENVLPDLPAQSGNNLEDIFYQNIVKKILESDTKEKRDHFILALKKGMEAIKG